MKLIKDELPEGVIRGAYVAGPYTIAALILGAGRAAMATIREQNLLYDLCEFCAGISE